MSADAERTLVTVERLGRRGDGLATRDGRPIAIPGALPGESVALGAGAVAPEILAPSPDRLPPTCPHASECGGCALQHASDRLLAAWKRERIVEALAAKGLAPEIAETQVSPPRTRRRVTFAAMRAKSGVRLGFHRARSHQVVPILDCLVARSEITAALPALEALGRIAAPRKRAVAVSVTVSLDGLDVAVSAAKALDLPLREAAGAWAGTADVARLAWNAETVAERRPPRQR
ncbi:MAG: class I SAM-dependent RNA methyltransferase, partial [Pseudomonadota bacterium]